MSKMPTDCTAEEIADELLYKTGKAMLSGDERLFVSCFALPTMIETRDARIVLRSSEQVALRFREVRAFMREAEIVDIVRTIVSAEYLDARKIGSTHAASLIGRDGRPTRKPFPVYSILKRHGGGEWKIAASVYAILDSEAHNRVLTGSADATGRKGDG